MFVVEIDRPLLFLERSPQRVRLERRKLTRPSSGSIEPFPRAAASASAALGSGRW